MISWTVLKNYLTDVLHISSRTLEYIAVYNILEGCVAGLSNKSIALRDESSIGYVQSVLTEFLGIYGWDEDLYINPYGIYKYSNGSLQAYISLCMWEDPTLHISRIQTFFIACERFESIEKEIEKYYAEPTT